MANSTWVAIGVWIELLPVGVQSVVGLFSWLDSLNFNSRKKNLIEAVFFTTIWMLWRFRNDMVFGNKKVRKDRIVESVKEFSFIWVSNRNKKYVSSWVDWLKNPSLLL